MRFAVVSFGTERDHYLGTSDGVGSHAMASAVLETAQERQWAKAQLARSAFRHATRKSVVMAAPTIAGDL